MAKQQRKARPRRVWKTFIGLDNDEIGAIQMCWQNFPDPLRHKMYFSRFDIETNLPLADLRRLFRVAGVAWRDYVTDTKSVNEEPDESEAELTEWLRSKK